MQKKTTKFVQQGTEQLQAEINWTTFSICSDLLAVRTRFNLEG
jgi:hypothetical protein